MDVFFRERIRKSRVMLVKNLDAASIMPYMLQEGIFTSSHAERLAACPTRSERAGMFLDELVRRGPTAKHVFLNSLRLTGQSFIADALDGIGVVSPPAGSVQIGNNNVMYVGGTTPPSASTVSKSTVFEDLLSAVSNLKNGEQKSERHGTTLLTSTETYVMPPPVSALGEREIPFLFAAKAFGYSTDTVLGWPGAPSKNDFVRAFASYEQEIYEVKTLIGMLENGGIHLVVTPRDERITKMLRGYSRATVLNGHVHVDIANIRCKLMSLADLDVIACLVHLMCFSEHRFIIRRSNPPKPNCYLLFRAGVLVDSDVIMRGDEKFVLEAVEMDESVVVRPSVSTACPW